MTLREELLELVDDVRGLLAPDELDQRTSKLTIITRAWAGGRVRSGAKWDQVVLELPQRYKVQQLSAKQAEFLLGSGGRYSPGDAVRVVVTPAYTGGGYTEAQLKPPVPQSGTEIIYLLDGAVAGEYSLAGLKLDRPYRYELTLLRTNRTP